ncbi:MAG: hypothetical protein J0L59_01695 [Xanthomonadales bacterium]|nr:hypothetical protein [Xanthomonadales bacterium]
MFDPRRVYECTTYDTSTGTCVVAAWVERTDFPELSSADALVLLSRIALVFAIAWAWKFVGRSVRM